jgi:hypothetical protein
MDQVGSCAVVRGSTTREAAVPPFASTTFRRIASTISVSVLFVCLLERESVQFSVFSRQFWKS